VKKIQDARHKNQDCLESVDDSQSKDDTGKRCRNQDARIRIVQSSLTIIKAKMMQEEEAGIKTQESGLFRVRGWLSIANVIQCELNQSCVGRDARCKHQDGLEFVDDYRPER